MRRPVDDMNRPDTGGDDAGRDDMAADPCEGVVCENGTCVDTGDEGQCSCDPGFVGETCADCARGYAGADCDMCAVGFMLDAVGGTCVPDPCAGDPCNGSTCVTETDPTGATSMSCDCSTGFEGDTCDTCETGYTGANCDACDVGYVLDSGLCVIPACSPIPCTEHGTCMDVDGDGNSECACDRNWTGRDCGTCAVGFTLDAAGDCVPDVCATVPCDNGTCELDPTGGGGGICVCETGWTGAACDSCAYGYTQVVVGTQTRCLNTLPVRDGRITGWFDAAETSTVDLINTDQVDLWWNRMKPWAMLEPGLVEHRPTYVASPKPGLKFDGNDAMWTAQSLVGITDSFTIFVVAEWAHNTNGQTLVDAWWPASIESPYRIYMADDRLSFNYGDLTPASADSVFIDGVGTGTQLAIAQRGPFLNGAVMKISDGTNEQSEPTDREDLSVETYSQLGSVHGSAISPWGGRGLEGLLHEVIYVKGTLTLAERAAIIAYLEVKWGL